MGKKEKALGSPMEVEGLGGWRPMDRESLALWIRVYLELDMPACGVCEGHGTPLDYLCHSFFEEEGDAVVWACRGGGKTMIGAVATLLDLLFKPGIQVRILGGSFEQSEKMYGYLLQLLRGNFPGMLKGEPTQRRLELVNGSRVEVLAQSGRCVRGQRVQKLRCDEVELFDEKVWQAAQLTTRSAQVKRVGANGEENVGVRGSVEAFSTMHEVGGLMQGIFKESVKNAKSGRRVFTWCIWDVIEKCPAARKCEGCELWEECGGRAKGASGFVPIEDVIAMKGRVSRTTWDHEMLCREPRPEKGVFPTFSRESHVRAVEGELRAGSRVMVDGRLFTVETVVAGVDFGYAHAFACLWMAMMREGTKPGGKRAVWVFDEMVKREQTLSKNVMAMRQRPWEVSMVYCDVAGKQRNSHSGVTDERFLREAGFATKCKGMKICEGIAMIRELMEPADNLPRFFVDTRCDGLITALGAYEKNKDGDPVKDGQHDHVIDALRYAVVNHGEGGRTEWRRY